MRKLLVLAMLLTGCVELDPVTGRPIGGASVPVVGASTSEPPVSTLVQDAPPIAPPPASSPLPASAAPRPSIAPAPTPTLSPVPTAKPMLQPTAEPTPTPLADPTPIPSAKPTPTPTAKPTPLAPISLSGTGKDATDVFNLRAGVVVFDVEHEGEDNFIVKLLDSNGDQVELVANEIGTYSASRAFGLEAGAYLLDINADGPWKVKILQPTSDDAADPLPYSGNGTTAHGPARLAGGLARFTMKHAGEGNFIVRLLNEQGEVEELLVNEIGGFEGTKAVGLDGGVYFFDIRADGAWTVTLE